MKKKILILGLCLILISGCAKTIPTLSNGEEAVVTFKNGDMFSVDDLYSELKKTASLQTLLNMIDKHILEKEYESELEDAQESAKSSLETIKTSYGDDALSAVQYYTGYQSFEAYEEYLYISYLQNRVVEDYAKGKITDKQIDNYYKDEIVGDIKVSHILITPEVTDDMTDEEKAAAEKKAKDEANDIIKELKKVSAKDVVTKFAELAKEKSDDSKTASDGGNLGKINKTTLDASYKDFATEAYKLKDGEYTSKVVQSELGYHIILRVESFEKAKLDTVKDSIIETLANKLIEDDATTAVKAMQEIRKSYGADIVDSEIQELYKNYIQNSLTNAEKQNEENE